MKKENETENFLSSRLPANLPQHKLSSLERTPVFSYTRIRFLSGHILLAAKAALELRFFRFT